MGLGHKIRTGYSKHSFLSRLARQSHDAKALPALPCQIMKQDQDRLGSTHVNSLRYLALFGAGVSGLLVFHTL